MKNIADELMEKAIVKMEAKPSVKDHGDVKLLINRTTASIKEYRIDHPAIAGAGEAAIGILAIAAGAALLNPIDCGGKVPELIGAAFGAGVGGVVGGTVMSLVGGIGVAMMGTAFSIPVAAIAAIGAGVGALSGSAVGWFGVELATSTISLAQVLFENISGAALIAFGCYMLCLAFRDLWKAGGEFIYYLKNLGVSPMTIGA